jgi:dipeptidyl aminopeptidase/acylaminoacyl peptidase
VFTRSRPGRTPVPALSDDGRWVAVREPGADNASHTMHVLAIDGSARKTLSLSMTVASGPHNPWVSNDGREVVVAAGETAVDSLKFHRVDVASGRATIVATAPRGRGVMGLGISPDGRSLAYRAPLQSYVEFYDVDVSAWLRPRNAASR